jgi:hypothetical protein
MKLSKCDSSTLFGVDNDQKYREIEPFVTIGIAQILVVSGKKNNFQ